MKNKSGNTAFGAGAVRLMEQFEPEGKRLFEDPVIYHLTNPVLHFLLKYKFVRNYFTRLSNNISTGIIGGQICRTRYIDDKTLSLLNEIEQVMILGAGLDTRAYRLKGLEKFEVYEVDLPNIQQIKKRKLKKYLKELPSNVTFVPIDFNKDTLENVLDKSSFDFTKSALVILEAVTQYINRNAVEDILKFISLLPQGSYFLFTYVLRDTIERKSQDTIKLMDWAEKNHSPFIFGINPREIISFLSPYNLEVIEDVGSDYYQKNYLDPIKRELEVLECERINFSKLTR
jgi:methyltransferase (TIGR00027 family)